MSKNKRYTGDSPWMERDWLYREYILKGKTAQQIAQEHKCKPSTIYSWASRHKLTKAEKTYKNKIYLYTEYIVNKRTMQDIAKENDCSGDTIRRWLQHYGIPIRGQSENMLKINISPEALYVEYVLNKKTILQIAQEYDMSRNRVSAMLTEYGIKKRTNSETQFLTRGKDRPQELSSKKWLEDNYIKKKRSKKDIANELQCDPSAVDYALQSFEIPIRGDSESKIGLFTGSNHPNWKGRSDVSALSREFFTRYQAPMVLARDSYQCRLCGSKQSLHVHHIIPLYIIIESVLNIHPELDMTQDKDRYRLFELVKQNNTFLDLDNLMTVCEKCHYNVIHGKRTISSQA